MKENFKFTLPIVVVAIAFLVSGIFIGKYVFKEVQVNNNDESIINDRVNDTNNITSDIDMNNYSEKITLGKYLYFLAVSVQRNCYSDYHNISWKDERTIILNNYDELFNSYTNNYIQNNEYFILKGVCYKRNDNGEVDASACWCGSGDPISIYTRLNNFEIVSSNDGEIKYSVEITEYDVQTDEVTNTYNDSFVIKNIDDNWKIDDYTYRYITYIAV